MPRVTVVIPAYNAEQYLPKTLDSILTQTLKDIEVIVVDDGSTDQTASIVSRLAQNDKRLSLIQQQNQYAGVARNNGMAQAKGDYLYFLDADDFITKDALELLVQRADQTNADVIVCRSLFFDNETHETSPIEYALRWIDFDSVVSGIDLSDKLFQFCVGWPWDKLFRRSYIENKGLTYQSLRTTNDAYFVFMALILANRVSFVKKPLVYYRTNNAKSLSRSRSKSWWNAFLAAEAIETKLHEVELFERFETTYLNWLFNFSIWNLLTIDEKGQIELYAEMVKRVLPRMSLDEKFYIHKRDYRNLLLALQEKGNLLASAIDLQDEVIRLREECCQLEREKKLKNRILRKLSLSKTGQRIKQQIEPDALDKLRSMYK